MILRKLCSGSCLYIFRAHFFPEAKVLFNKPRVCRYFPNVSFPFTKKKQFLTRAEASRQTKRKRR